MIHDLLFVLCDVSFKVFIDLVLLAVNLPYVIVSIEFQLELLVELNRTLDSTICSLEYHLVFQPSELEKSFARGLELAVPMVFP